MSRNRIKLLAVYMIAASILFFLWNISRKDHSQIEQKKHAASLKSEDEISKPSTDKKFLGKINQQQQKQYIKEEPKHFIEEEPKGNEQNKNDTKATLSSDEDLGILEKKTVVELWDDWQIALAMGDRSSNLIKAALIKKLRINPDPGVLKNLESVLQSTEIPYDEKIPVVDLLQRAATPETLKILIESAQNLTLHQKDNKAILAGIANFGKYGWKDTFHEELSPILEKEWVNSSELENSYKEAIANALASVGSESGVKVLIDSLSSDKVDKETKRIIGSAFSRLKNPAAVKPLAEILYKEKYYGNSIWELSGDALASMDHPDATRTLVNWAQSSGSEDLKWVERWFGEIRDPSSIEVIEDSIIRDTYQNSDIYFTLKNIIDEKL